MEKLLKIFRPIARIVLPKVVIVGFDIQDRHIAAVANLRQLEKIIPIASGIETLPEAAIQDGKIAARDPVFQAAKKLIQSIPIPRLKSEPVLVISLPPHHIYTETAVFPLMNAKALEEAIQLKLETSLPWPLREAYVDWKRIDIGDSKKIAIFITAIAKSILDNYLGIFLQGKWRVAACEFHLMSLARLLNIETQEPFIFVLLDEDGAEFGIFHRGMMLSHYLEKAEEGSRAIGERLGSQARSLTTYAAGELGLKIATIVLFDKIGIEHQIEKLEKELEVPVKYFMHPEGFDPSLFIAVGASQRKLSLPEESINLIPVGSGGRYQENLILRTLHLWTNILFIFALILILSFSGVVVFLRGQRRALEGETKELRVSLERQMMQSSDSIKQADSFNQLVFAMTKAASARSSLGQKLNVIYQEAAGAEVNVLGVKKESPERPLVVTIFTDSRDQALDFKARLEASKQFSSVDIPFAELIPENNLIVNVSLHFKI